MRQARSFAIVPVMILSAGLSAAQAGSDLDAKAANYFTVRWSRFDYTKADTIENSEGTAKPGTSENLKLSCEITIRDPNLVLGTIQDGVITQLTGRRGQEIDVVNSSPSRAAPVVVNSSSSRAGQVVVSPSSSRASHFYERPQHRQRFTPPPQEPRWKTLMQSVLRLSPNKSSTPRVVWELQPSHLDLQLDTRTLDQAGGELRQVKGYFHALIAESLEKVDVPLEPNEQWVRLTPDLEIRVQEATSTASSYRYRIDARPQEGFLRPLSLGDSLPGRLVVDRQFLGPDGKPTQQFQGGSPWLPPHVAGSGGGSGGNRQIKAIRFLIAVHPTDCRVPFEFQHVPLPDPNQPPARHRAGN